MTPTRRLPADAPAHRVNGGLRIAYVTMAFPNPSETFATNDVRGLVARGAQVRVHALRRAWPEAAALLAERGIADVEVTHHRGAATWLAGLPAAWRHPRVAIGLLLRVLWSCATAPGHLLRSLLLLPRVLEIFTELRDDPPDVVHAYWAHYPTLVLDLVQRHLPAVVSSVSFSAYDIHRGFPLTGPVARRADVVRSLARTTAREAAELFRLDADAIEVIHDGVDLTLLPAAVPRTPRLVLTVGRLDRMKATHLVLEAFAAAHEKLPDATLRVLGAGPERERLEVLAAELGVAQATTFVGHRPQVEVLAELQRADVFLFMSREERLPNVVKEAMVCGCACVISRTVGIEELVQDGVTGFVVEQEDIAAAADRVVGLLDGSLPSRSMTEAAAAWIRESFDVRVSVDRYLRCWGERVALRRSQRDGAGGVPSG